MDKLFIYFFVEEASIDYPKTLQALHGYITQNYFINKNNLKKLNICYNNSDSTLISINDENDYKSFLKKKINNLYLDAGQNYELYEEFLSQKEKKDVNEDIKKLNDLIKKEEELQKLYRAKIKKDEEELTEINRLIVYYSMLKTEKIKSINNNKKMLQKDHNKIINEISELKSKLGIK